MDEQKRKLFVVTASSIVDTGKVSFRFMFDSGARFVDFSDIANQYSWLRLRKKADDEIDPFKLARREPGAVGDDGVKKWEIFVFKCSEGQIMTASADESPKDSIEQGLVRIIEETPSCVILMVRHLFERFERVCRAFPEIELGFHHYEGELKTS